MNQITVMEADYSNVEHARAIITLLDAYAQDSMGGGNALGSWTKGHLIPALSKRHDALTLLAVHAGQAVGLLNAFEGFSTFKAKALLNIHDVFVLPTHRHQGVGRELFAYVETVARRREYCKLTLEVLAENHHAKQLYQKVGFAPYQLDEKVGNALFYEKML